LYRDYVHAVLLLYRDYVHAVLLLYRDYVHAVLLWTEQEPTWVVTIIFAALFTLVSLPLAWGYIVINMAAG